MPQERLQRTNLGQRPAQAPELEGLQDPIPGLLERLPGGPYRELCKLLPHSPAGFLPVFAIDAAQAPPITRHLFASSLVVLTGLLSLELLADLLDNLASPGPFPCKARSCGQRFQGLLGFESSLDLPRRR